VEGKNYKNVRENENEGLLLLRNSKSIIKSEESSNTNQNLQRNNHQQQSQSKLKRRYEDLITNQNESYSESESENEKEREKKVRSVVVSDINSLFLSSLNQISQHRNQNTTKNRIKNIKNERNFILTKNPSFTIEFSKTIVSLLFSRNGLQ
jgi:hypothetical protein